jgi:glycosyltransferase involved in cell wall biosynthesis
LSKKKQLLIIGNGAISIDSDDNAYVHKQIGTFLWELNKQVIVTYVSMLNQGEKSQLLQNYSLSQNKINYLFISKKRLLRSYLIKLLRQIKQADYVYIFMPGTLGYLVSISCLVLKKQYGFYIRGEKTNNKLFRYLVKKTTFNVLVPSKVINYLKCKKLSVNYARPLIEDIFYLKESKTQAIFGGTTKCLVVGRLEKNKGIEDIIEAISFLRKNNLEKLKINFYFIGNGPYYNKLKTLQSNNRKTSLIRVYTLGFIYEPGKLKKCYVSADIMLLASHHEGFPRVIYEAALSKCLIVTTLVGGIGRIMKDRNNCRVVNTNSFRSIVQVLGEILNEKSKNEHYVNNAYYEISCIIKNLRPHSNLLINYLNENLD